MEGRRDGVSAATGTSCENDSQHHAHIGHGILVDGTAQAMAVELHLKDILGGQKGVDVLAVRAICPDDAVEQLIEDVRYLAHAREAERRRAALDRMGGAKIAFRPLASGAAISTASNSRSFFSQQFFGLIEKDPKTG